MKKTVILIVSDMDTSNVIPKVKQTLVDYFGLRMIERQDEEEKALFPGIVLKIKLQDEDKQAIDALIREKWKSKVCLITIDGEENKCSSYQCLIEADVYGTTEI